MARLYDINGNPVDVPDNQVVDALASGKLGFPQGQGVPMVSPDGGVYEMSPEDAIGAAKEGWFFEGAEQRRQRELQEQFGGAGGQAAAALAGVGRGLTFGLSDVALTKTGIVDPETLQALKEANPTASTVGELGAIGGSLLLTGGASAAGGGSRLLRGVTAAPRAAARAGLATERAVSRLLGPAAERGFLGRIATRGAELGAGSAIEGALYGGGQAISEMALGDLEATAENLIGHVGMGAVIGGGFGAALGSGFQGVKELVTGTGKLTKKGTEALVGMWEQQTGNKAIPGLADAYAKLSGAVTGRMDDVTTLMQSPEARKLATTSDDVISKFGLNLAEHANKMDETASEIIFQATGKIKKEVMKEIASMGKGDAVVTDMIGPRLGKNKWGGGFLNEIRGRLDEMITAGRGEFEFTGQLKRLRDNVDARMKAIGKISREGGDVVAGRVFNELDELKRGWGQVRSRMGDAFRRNPMPAMADTMDELAKQYKRLQYTLEDEALWGIKAARMQREVNAKWAQYLTRAEHKSNYPFVRRTGTKDFGEAGARLGKYTYEHDPGQWSRFVKDLGDDAKIKLDREWLEHQLTTKEDLLKEIVKQYDMPPNVAKNLDNFIASKRRLQDVIDAADKTVGLRNQLRALDEATRGSGFSTEMGVVGGAILGGPLGALAGGALGAILNPARTIRQLTTLERIAGGYKQRIKLGLQRYVSKYKARPKRPSRVKRMIAPSSVNALQDTSFFGEKRKSKNRHEAFKHRMQELQAFTTPQTGTEALSKSTETVSKVAPQVAEQVHAKAVQAANFLISKAPKDPGFITVFGPEWKPSEMELSKFERYVKAVDDPHSVIRDLENGTLTHEAVETLKTIYPKIYGQIVEELVANLPELRETLPYQERLQLSLLFDIPVDPTMRPEFIEAMQQSLAMLRPSIEAIPPPSFSKAVERIKPELHMTQMQRIAAKQGGYA